MALFDKVNHIGVEMSKLVEYVPYFECEYYDKLYYRDFCNQAYKIFCNGEKMYPGIDLEFLYNLYFSSNARYQAETGSPRYLNLSSVEILEELESKGFIDKNNYPKSDKSIDSFYGDSILWLVMQWSDLTFKYKIYSKDLIKSLSFENMMWAYQVGHERSMDSESDILYDIYVLGRDGNINYDSEF